MRAVPSILWFIAVLLIGSADAQLLGITRGASCADPNWSSVVLLIGNDNAANGTTTFVDQSSFLHTMTKAGSPQYSNSSPPTGMTTTISLNGSAFLISPSTTDFDFGSGDFTVEAYVKFTSSVDNQAFLTKWRGFSGWDQFILDVASGSLRLVTRTLDGQQSVTKAWTPASGIWYHVAGVRSGNTSYIFIDGVLQNTGSITNALNYSVSSDFNAATIGGGSDNLNGNLASGRLTRGVARYTGNFTPPSLPLPTC